MHISMKKKKTNYPFWMLKLFKSKVNLQPQFIVNLFLVTLIVFLPSVYKFSLIHTLVYRCFLICQD